MSASSEQFLAPLRTKHGEWQAAVATTLGEPQRLTSPERSLLIDPGIDRCLSPISVWDATIKREAGRSHAPRNLTAILAAEFRMLTLSAALLEEAAELPRHDMDPFDRVPDRACAA